MSECIGPHDERTETLENLLLCARHRRQMDRDVAEVQALILDTMHVRDGGAPADHSPRGKAPKKRADPPAPGDVTIMALYDSRTAADRISYRPTWHKLGWSEGDQSEPMPNVLAVVASWTLLVADERPLTATLPKSVLGQLDLLARHHEWLAAQPFVDDYLLEMAELRKALRFAVGDVEHFRIATCDLPVETRSEVVIRRNRAVRLVVNQGKATAVIIHRNRPARIVRLCGGRITVRNGDDVWRCHNCAATWITDQQKARFAIKELAG